LADKKDWEKKDDYMKRALQLAEFERKWIVQHYFDHRRQDLPEHKIDFDKETKTSIDYYKAVIDTLNSMRLEVGLPSVLA